MTSEGNDNGRTHEPNLREITSELDGLRELMDERDRRYGTVAQDAKEAVAAALSAQKELTTAAFAASEKAIGKAEAAQIDYNARSNEFRQALDDSNKDKLSRVEADNRFHVVEEKIGDGKRALDQYKDSQAAEIRSLRETRSMNVGMKEAATETRAQSNITTTQVIGLIAALAAIGYLILHYKP